MPCPACGRTYCAPGPGLPRRGLICGRPLLPEPLVDNFRVEANDEGRWYPCMDRDWPSKEAALNAIDSLRHCHPPCRGEYRVIDKATGHVVATARV